MKNSQENFKDKINELVNLYKQRKFSEVFETAKILIKDHPESFVIWNLLGVASKGLGRIDDSIKSLKKVIELNPEYADGYNNLGVILQEKGQLDESIECFNKALSLKPNYTQAFNNAAIAYRDLGKKNKSIEYFKKAISLNPNYPEAYNNLATTLKEQGKLDEAIRLFNKALSLKPNYAEVYYNLGLIFYEHGEFNKASDSYNKAISLNPNYPEAYNNLATTLKEQGKLDEAIRLFNKALSLKPNYAEVYYNLGIIEKSQNKFDEAVTLYKKALSLRPGYVDAIYNLGIIFQEQGKLDKAIYFFNKAVSLRPDYERAKAQELYQKASICDWKNIEQDKEVISKIGNFNNHVPPFTLLSFEDNPRNHYLRSKIYAKKKYFQKKIKLNKSQPKLKNKRIRIGYFSADFQNHATMYLAAKIFEKYDRKKFEIYVYSFGLSTNDDEVRQNLINSVNNFKDVINLSEKDIALLARKDNIDIAVDLKGYTKNARTGIFAYRAAPIQINYLGYPGTLGADFIDYIIADPIIIPFDQRHNYSEKIIYLPYTYQPNDNLRKISNKNFNKTEMKLPINGFIFCCFNNSYKISLNEFKIWMRLLKKIKGSVLWLIKSNKWAEHNLLNEAQKLGVENDRIIFADLLTHSDHLARYKLADLFLDTFNYNAHTTASDALWSGLPVVTKIGHAFPARVTASLLNAVGLPELVVKSEIDYENLILDLATSPTKLLKIKEKLIINRLSKPLFDSELYNKHLEEGFEQVYQNNLKGKKIKTIYIKDKSPNCLDII